MRDASLISTIIEQANLDYADLSRALLSQTSLFDAHLENTNLEGARITDMYLGSLVQGLQLSEDLRISDQQLSNAFSRFLAREGARGKPTIKLIMGRSVPGVRSSNARGQRSTGRPASSRTVKGPRARG